ncbi:MAG: putative metal-dependent hydrolase [Planctomycetota bacterium]|jgi:predicted metal-dependent hydrolase
MEDLHITYRQSKRAKNIGIRIIPGGEVIVTTPAGVHPASGERFLREKLSWVRKHIGKMSSFVQVCPPRTRTNYLKFKEQARELVAERVAFWQSQMDSRFVCNKIYIRDTKTRWGTCSTKRNLGFSYRIVFLSPEVCDYLIVHELCHLVHMNHSEQFWTLVGLYLPEYREQRDELRLTV